MKDDEDKRSLELIDQHTQQEEQMIMKVYQVLNCIDRSRFTLTDARGIVTQRENLRKALGL